MAHDESDYITISRKKLEKVEGLISQIAKKVGGKDDRPKVDH